jgi:hypothetical protein
MSNPRPEDGKGAASVDGTWAHVGRRLGRTLRWHLSIFLSLNLALTIVNIATGAPWWAVWPLVATGFALALHYFAYRATAVDEEWVAARVTELNLKSYDRSHIESIRERVETESYGRQRDDAG